MIFEHGQDRAHKRHLSKSFRNAVRDEISWLKSLWVEIEFERAFLTRLTYAFQIDLRMLVVSNALTHSTTAAAFSHTLGTIWSLTRLGALRNAGRH